MPAGNIYRMSWDEDDRKGQHRSSQQFFISLLQSWLWLPTVTVYRSHSYSWKPSHSISNLLSLSLSLLWSQQSRGTLYVLKLLISVFHAWKSISYDHQVVIELLTDRRAEDEVLPSGTIEESREDMDASEIIILWWSGSEGQESGLRMFGEDKDCCGWCHMRIPWNWRKWSEWNVKWSRKISFDQRVIVLSPILDANPSRFSQLCSSSRLRCSERQRRQGS